MRKGVVIGGAAVFALVLGGGYFGADYFANAKVRESAEVFAGNMRRVTKDFRYGSVEADLLSQSVVMRDVDVTTVTNDRFRAKALMVKDFDWRNGASPHYADFLVRQADMPSSAIVDLATGTAAMLAQFMGVSTIPSNNTRRLLDRAGYERATGDVHVRYRYDAEARTLSLSESTIDIAGFGLVTVDVKLGNVPPEVIRRPERAMTAAIGVTLISASLKFQDRTMVSRLLKAYAAERRLSEADALARVLRDLRSERDRTRNAIEREALEALIRFVERPTEITLAMSPRDPVLLANSVVLLFGGRSFKDSFGLTITAR